MANRLPSGYFKQAIGYVSAKFQSEGRVEDVNLRVTGLQREVKAKKQNEKLQTEKKRLSPVALLH